jgi:hypothetical protein
MKTLTFAGALSVCFFSVGLVKAATVITFEDLAEGATLSPVFSPRRDFFAERFYRRQQ